MQSMLLKYTIKRGNTKSWDRPKKIRTCSNCIQFDENIQSWFFKYCEMQSDVEHYLYCVYELTLHSSGCWKESILLCVFNYCNNKQPTICFLLFSILQMLTFISKSMVSTSATATLLFVHRKASGRGGLNCKTSIAFPCFTGPMSFTNFSSLGAHTAFQNTLCSKTKELSIHLPLT